MYALFVAFKYNTQYRTDIEWRFQGFAEEEYQLQSFRNSVTKDIMNTRGLALQTIGYHVVKLEVNNG